MQSVHECCDFASKVIVSFKFCIMAVEWCLSLSLFFFFLTIQSKKYKVKGRLSCHSESRSLRNNPLLLTFYKAVLVYEVTQIWNYNIEMLIEQCPATNSIFLLVANQTCVCVGCVMTNESNTVFIHCYHPEQIASDILSNKLFITLNIL